MIARFSYYSAKDERLSWKSSSKLRNCDGEFSGDAAGGAGGALRTSSVLGGV